MGGDAMRLSFLVCIVALICASQADPNITNVHIVFMNHLDVGYNGIYPEVGFINNVLNKYFTEYFPRAAAVGKALSEGGYQETFIYTTHPWLVDLYINCPPNLTLSGVQLKCPDRYGIGNLTQAVKAGHITWQGNTMNLQTDNIDDWLMDYSLSVSDRLDTHFGVYRKFKVLSQRDVPGITQAVIPSLVKHNVKAVSVGVNGGTSPPAVPRLFTWTYNNQSVMATWNPGGYPSNPGSDPNHPGGLSKDHCAWFEGFPEALCFAFRTDNSGPPMDVKELQSYYDILRVEFPGATLQASTLEKFFEAVQPIASELPVVDNEIGDTWIQGIASDPRKEQEYRAVSRVLKKCIKQGSCRLEESRVLNASRFLAKLPEHTWGVPGVNDRVNYTNEALNRNLRAKDPRYMNATLSWLEQRNFTYLAIEALGELSVVKQVQEEMSNIQPRRPDLEDYISMLPDAWGKVHLCLGGVQIGFGGDGAITMLSVAGKANWASPVNPLSKFVYVSYNESDIEWFRSYYGYVPGGDPGYGKDNITMNAQPDSRVWPSELDAVYAKQGVDIRFQWFNKIKTRIPEALTLVFQPNLSPQYSWKLSKLGQLVDPMNVVLNGSQYIHGIDDNGVYYTDDAGSGLQVASLDVPLAVVMTTERRHPVVYGAPMAPINATITAIGFNAYNNVWDTNYIYWYPYIEEDADFSARFSINLL